MITIGYSTRETNPKLSNYFRQSCGLKGVQVIEKVNNGEKSLSQVYNEIIDESVNNIVVLCHDDIYFDTNRWGKKLLKSVETHSDYGIFGVAGSTYMPKSGQWWEDRTKMFGIVNHEHEGKKWVSKYSQNEGNQLDNVVLVDGLFIVINKKNIKKQFTTVYNLKNNHEQPLIINYRPKTNFDFNKDVFNQNRVIGPLEGASHLPK